MEGPVIVAGTEASSARDGIDVDSRRDVTLSRRAKRLGILAVVLCPCHLPLVATVFAVVGFGGAAAALRDNLVLLSLALGAMAVVSLWLAVRSSRAATACRLPPPPRSPRTGASNG